MSYPDPSTPPRTPTVARPVGPALRDELLTALSLDGKSQGRVMARVLHARIPEIGGVREQGAMFAETEACCATHVDDILGLLEAGGSVDDIAAPDCGREYAVGFVHRRIPLAALMRAYRVGQNHLWETFAQRLRSADDPAAAQGLQIATALLFEYVDRVARDVADVYQQERDGWVRSAAAIREETVHDLLDGTPLDADVASRRLGYELRGRHTALIVSGDPDRAPLGSAALERAAHSAAAALGGGEPLVVPVGAAAVWAWVPTGSADDEDVHDRAQRLVPAPGLRLAIGRPAAGAEGFRVSHDEARHAADLHGALSGGTASYRSLELVSLLAADPERARRFVAHELGPLARDDDAAAGLRETALAFLDHGGSHVGAARALHVHKNTVYTRVRRAERELGIPVAPGRAGLHAALTLAVTTPDRVIARTPPPAAG